MFRFCSMGLTAGLGAVLIVMALPAPTLAATLHYHATLRPSSVVFSAGAGEPGAFAQFGLNVNTETDELCSSVGPLTGLEGLTAAHVHLGVEVSNGPIVAEMDLPPRDGGIGSCVAVSSEVIAGIVADPSQYYVDLHTEEFPDGAVRGQLSLTGMCRLWGWTDAVAGDEASTELVAYEGEGVLVGGRFFEGAIVEIEITRDGTVVSTQSVTPDEPPFTWETSLEFDFDDSGEWVVSASVAGVGQCEAQVEISVVDNGAGPGTPSNGGTPLPNTAAIQTDGLPAPSILGVVALLVSAAWCIAFAFGIHNSRASAHDAVLIGPMNGPMKESIQCPSFDSWPSCLRSLWRSGSGRPSTTPASPPAWTRPRALRPHRAIRCRSRTTGTATVGRTGTGRAASGSSGSCS